MDRPITHGGDIRTYRMCKCYKCEIIARCLPSFDFYTLEEDGSDGPLYCEACFQSIILEKHNIKFNNRNEA